MLKEGLFVVIAVVVAGLMAVPAHADDSDREGSWQFSMPINYLSGSEFDGAGGSTINLNDDYGFGIGFGYNFNERFYLGGEFTWMYVNYEVEVESADNPPIADISVSGELDASTFQVRGQYNFMEKTFTPFIGAGLGWTYIDSNIASGPSQGVCWWDPWWGYICDTWQPTYDDTTFSYGGNVGVRAELTDSFYLEFRYGIMFLDTNGDDADLDGFRLELGWMFGN